MIDLDDVRITRELTVLADDLETGVVQPDSFNMQICCRDDRDCGTVACIGGHLAMRLGMSVLDADDWVMDIQCQASHLTTLFYPPLSINWSRVTPVIAARSIRSWLATGEPDWSDAEYK